MYGAKILPILGTVPVLESLELPVMLIKPPTVLKSVPSSKTMIQESIDITWLNLQGIPLFDNNMTNIGEINEYTVVCSDKLLNRLYSFLRIIIPLQRSD